MIKNASMNLYVRVQRLHLTICVFACMDPIVYMGSVWLFGALFQSLMFTLFSLPLSLSLYPCSTRKQNYMMNFARQTGVRHYYSRKRRALRQRA